MHLLLILQLLCLMLVHYSQMAFKSVITYSNCTHVIAFTATSICSCPVPPMITPGSPPSKKCTSLVTFLAHSCSSSLHWGHLKEYRNTATSFNRESWLAVHTKVLQFQPEFHLWLSGLSFDYSAVVFSSATCHHRWSCSNFITVQPQFQPKRASSGTVASAHFHTTVEWPARHDIMDNLLHSPLTCVSFAPR